jgi:hypothetical protein
MERDQTVAIHLPATPSIIRGIAVRLRGSTRLASFDCSWIAPTEPVETTIIIELVVSTGFWMIEQRNHASGPIDWTIPLTAAVYSNPDWSSLITETPELTLRAWGLPPMFECHLVGPPDTVTVDEVTLLVDGDFPTPAGVTSWGRVKSIYR